ncbi:MAG: hypothetical protein Kow0063_15420 [Anaerolineae bacterium]
MVPDLVTEADTLALVIPNVADPVAALLEMYEDLSRPIPPALLPLIPESKSPLWTETPVPALRI